MAAGSTVTHRPPPSSSFSLSTAAGSTLAVMSEVLPTRPTTRTRTRSPSRSTELIWPCHWFGDAGPAAPPSLGDSRLTVTEQVVGDQQVGRAGRAQDGAKLAPDVGLDRHVERGERLVQ